MQYKEEKQSVQEGEVQVFDLERALWVTGGNHGIVRRATLSFMKHMPERFEQLKRAASERDAEETQRIAHSIKGASASVGGERLRAAALEMENESREQKLERFDVLLAEMTAEFGLLQAALAEYEQRAASEDPQAGEALSS